MIYVDPLHGRLKHHSHHKHFHTNITVNERLNETTVQYELKHFQDKADQGKDPV